MNTERLSIPRGCIELAAVAMGLFSLLASCSDAVVPGFVPPTPTDASDVRRDAGARDSGEHFCNNLQCRQMEIGPGLPPTSIRGIVHDPAGVNPL